MLVFFMRLYYLNTGKRQNFLTEFEKNNEKNPKEKTPEKSKKLADIPEILFLRVLIRLPCL
jgi:hypothetical protein